MWCRLTASAHSLLVRLNDQGAKPIFEKWTAMLTPLTLDN
jgi:hypothetical protein